MNTPNCIFVKNEVIGKTKDEAIAASNLNLMVDATQSYNKWAKENITSEENVKEWMKDYLRKKKYDKPGLGAYIVTQTGSQDTRKRPYEFEKPKYDKRTHSFEKFYVGRSQTTGAEVFTEKTSKAAEQAAKEWTSKNQTGVDIYIEARVKEKNSLYAKCNYAPSKGTQPYKILSFGYNKVD